MQHRFKSTDCRQDLDIAYLEQNSKTGVIIIKLMKRAKISISAGMSKSNRFGHFQDFCDNTTICYTLK